MTSPIFVFDAYGTLFDVHSAVGRYKDEVGPKSDLLSAIWRAKQLEYTWIHARLEKTVTFASVTEQGLDYAIAAIGGLQPGLREELLSSYRSLKPYDEVPDVLDDLKGAGARLAILSNGDPEMLDAAVYAAGFEGLFDAVLSVAEAGVFKPAMPVYALATRFFDCEPSAISFQSSNRWDIAGAHVAGFRTVWVNRTGVPDEYPDMPAGRTIDDLTELVDDLEALAEAANEN
ncbi:MAG: haloacid dehalogenase type II [Hyphomicrobium aestuarii]|nr:haloacid dehalogenase type II [Hyphomicrobium aestuarii]